MIDRKIPQGCVHHRSLAPVIHENVRNGVAGGLNWLGRGWQVLGYVAVPAVGAGAVLRCPWSVVPDRPADHEVRLTYGVPSTLENFSRRNPTFPCWQAIPCFYAPITPPLP